MSDYHHRGPGFVSRLYPTNFSGNIWSGTGFTEPHEDNWVAACISSEIRSRKLKLKLKDNSSLTTMPSVCHLSVNVSLDLGYLELQYHGFNFKLTNTLLYEFHDVTRANLAVVHMSIVCYHTLKHFLII